MILSQRGNVSDVQIKFYVQTVCRQIKHFREERNVSQTELGMTLGISGQAMGKIEKGSTELRLSHLCQISEHLKTPLDRFLQLEPSDTIVTDLEEKVKQLHQRIKELEDQHGKDQLFIELLEKEIKK